MDSQLRRSQAQPPALKTYVWFLLHIHLSSHNTAVDRIHSSLNPSVYVSVPKHSDLYSVDLHQEANGFHEDRSREGPPKYLAELFRFETKEEDGGKTLELRADSGLMGG